MAPIVTVLHPYTLVFGRSWYVIGYSELFYSIRTFKQSRILETEPLTDVFLPPFDFTLERYLGNAWRMIPGAGPDEEVVVRFSKKVSQNVVEVCWHRTQQTRYLADGRVELRFLVSGLTEIVWWVLGYGPEAEVLSPGALRKMIAEHVQKMTAIYS